MKRMPSIKSVMTPFPYSVDMNDHLGAVVAMMAEHKVRTLPVLEEGKVVGVISDKDIELCRALNGGKTPDEKLLVKSACKQEPYIVELSEPLDSVLLHMTESGTVAALIVKNGRLAGIFTTRDASRCYAEFLKRSYSSSTLTELEDDIA